MGRMVAAAVAESDDLDLVAAIDAPGSELVGQDVGPLCGLGKLDVPILDHVPGHLDGVIDFSVPEASVRAAEECASRKIPLLVCTTGHDAAQRERLVATHHECALLIAANTSLVVNLLLKLTRIAGETLNGRDFDVEIIERHHRYKVDSPSGTALRFAEVLEEAMGLHGRKYGREGILGQRPRQELGIHALRGGDNVGEHTIVFSTLGESMELVHKGHSRASYVSGALAAIRYLIGKPAGLYTMADVLGL